VIITDSMWMQQAIFFSRPEEVNIWIDVVALINLEETLSGGSAPAAIEIIKDGIMSYGATLDIGDDVINGRVLCKVVDVSGVGSAVVTMAARTDNLTPLPGEYIAGNITISQTQVAVFNRDQIAVSLT
jgi:hypothetical protein